VQSLSCRSRNGSLEVSEVPAPEPGSGELLVEGVALESAAPTGDRRWRVRLGSAGEHA